jgi:hypothetical protein
MGPISYPEMAGLLQQIAMDPRTKRGMGYPSPTEGAIPYAGGGGRTIRAYHGTMTREPFSKFDLDKATNPKERGLFMTPSKAVAERYNQSGKGQTIPLDVTLKNAARVDYAKAFGTDMYSTKKMSKAIDLARKKGKDFLIVDNIIDMGGPQQQIIALNPRGLVKNAKTGSTMFGMAAGLLGLGQLGDDESR